MGVRCFQPKWVSPGGLHSCCYAETRSLLHTHTHTHTYNALRSVTPREENPFLPSSDLTYLSEAEERERENKKEKERENPTRAEFFTPSSREEKEEEDIAAGKK